MLTMVYIHVKFERLIINSSTVMEQNTNLHLIFKWEILKVAMDSAHGGAHCTYIRSLEDLSLIVVTVSQWT